MSETGTSKRIRVKKQALPPRGGAPLAELAGQTPITAAELAALDILLEQWPVGKRTLVLETVNEREDLVLRTLDARGLLRYHAPILDGATAMVTRPAPDRDLAAALDRPRRRRRHRTR